MNRSRPIIGIPTQTLQSLGGISAAIPPSWVMSQRYVQTLTNAGALPWLVPLVDEDTLRGIYESLDAIFLPGGADIDPMSYGTSPHATCDKTDRERDRVELALAKWAIADGKPVLGVCRGMQLINVAMGGSLYQDLATQFPNGIKHDYFPFGGHGHTRDYLAHDVRIADDSRLARLFGADTIKVNSMHHQGVRAIAGGLVPTAHAPDGLMEALEGPGPAYLLAVQWHPEALTERDEGTRRLFAEFVEAANEYRVSATPV
jgi:putative glutamine amidotransferase